MEPSDSGMGLQEGLDFSRFAVVETKLQRVKTIQAVKADNVTPRLQREFFEKTAHPLDTKQ